MKTRYIIAPIVILAMLAAFSAPVMAQQGCRDDIKTRDCAVTSSGFLNGTITNGSVIVLCNMTGLYQHPDDNWTITLPPGEVVVAYVHWHRWGACHDTTVTAEFWNGNGYYQSVGFPYFNYNCTAQKEWNNESRGVWWSGYSPRQGNHHYYWRVNATPGVNKFKATGCYPTSGEHCDGRWFIAVINNTDIDNVTHQGHWWHNIGYDKIESSPGNITWFYNATGDPINTNANYSLWTAQSHYGTSTPSIDFNGQSVGNISSSCLCHGDGEYDDFSMCEFNVPSTLIEADGDQNVTFTYKDDSYYAFFATLAEAVPRADLWVSDIEFIPEVLRADQNFTVNVTVENKGSSDVTHTFKVSLYINGSSYENKTIAGLGAGENETKSFTNISLPYGCHEFKVVADPDYNVTEEVQIRRYDDTKTKWYQVGGNVIVVHNNSQLTNHQDFINRNGIYYLENKTITNCAGCGITIENTTLPIVIQNCTVHNCGYRGSSSGYPAGICLHNVTNVTIGAEGNTIENNTNAGIRVENSTYVDIMDNYIRNNTIYGIYVYPEHLVKPPYPEYVKYINITNNTVIGNREGIALTEAFNCTVNCNNVSDNTKYGIYVCGNYSRIYHNRIMNNGEYGMKLFNASHNYVYWNDFIDNNGSVNPQAYDMWEYQPGLDPKNHWNTSWNVSYTYNGSTYENYTGNYWNYTVGDTNNDGIGDTAYKIGGATNAYDYRPMMMRWRWWLCGDVDRSGGSGDVWMGDYSKLYYHVKDDIPLNSMWAADVDCSCDVWMGDYSKLYYHVKDNIPLNCCKGCKCGWLQ